MRAMRDGLVRGQRNHLEGQMSFITLIYILKHTIVIACAVDDVRNFVVNLPELMSAMRQGDVYVHVLFDNPPWWE